MALKVAWTWQRSLQHTHSHIISLPSIFFSSLLHLSTTFASSHSALSFSLLPPRRLSAHRFTAISSFPVFRPSLLISPCLPPLFSCSSPPVWMDWQLPFPLLLSLLAACYFHIDSEESLRQFAQLCETLLSKTDLIASQCLYHCWQ